jgi:excisionase family DNA binding protein
MPTMAHNDELTTAEVAGALGIGQRRVIDLIRAGRLPARRVGPIYLIRSADLRLVRVRKPGRPWPSRKKK